MSADKVNSLQEIARIVQPLSQETEALLRPLKWVADHDRILIDIHKDLETFVVSTFNAPSVNSERQKPRGIESNPRKWGQRIPGARLDNKERLLLPATDFTGIVLAALWPEHKTHFNSIAARTKYELLSLEWQAYFLSAYAQAQYKANAVVPAPAAEMPFKDERHKPADYQRVAAYCASIVPGYGFFGEQGTGKTFSAILAIERRARQWTEKQTKDIAAGLITRKRPYLACVVCPKNVRLNWATELQLFSTLRQEHVIYSGDYIKRSQLLMEAMARSTEHCDISYVIMSYGLMSRDISPLSALPWNTSLLDEAHFICNAKSNRTKASIQLRDASQQRLVATGTPMPNKVTDLQAIFEFMGRGYSGFLSQKLFKEYYAQVAEPSGHAGPSRIVGLKNAPLLQERIARMTFVIRKSEALEGLPKKTYDLIAVDMTPEQASVYRTALNGILIDAEKELGGDAPGGNYSMVLQNVLKKMLRLSQITSGFYVSDALYNDDGSIAQESECHRFDPNNKLETLIDLVKPKPVTSKTIVWANWRHDIATISARLRYEGIKHVTFTGSTSERDRAEAMRLFNECHTTNVFLGNPKAGGIGVNLLGQANEFTNCDHIIYYSQDFSASARSQSEDRPHRRGTRVPVRITDLVVPNTIDQEIRERVVEKRANSVRVQDVRDLIGRLAMSAKAIGEMG